MDAVEFYESALTSAKTDDEKRFAIVRWVKSKERLEIFYRGEKQYRRADETRDEVTKVKAHHEIQPAELVGEYRGNAAAVLRSGVTFFVSVTGTQQG